MMFANSNRLIKLSDSINLEQKFSLPLSDALNLFQHVSLSPSLTCSLSLVGTEIKCFREERNTSYYIVYNYTVYAAAHHPHQLQKQTVTNDLAFVPGLLSPRSSTVHVRYCQIVDNHNTRLKHSKPYKTN